MKKIEYLSLMAMLIVCSCKPGTNQDNNEVEIKEKKQEVKLSAPYKEFVGKWHIDSVAENITQNMRKAVKEEFFDFKKDSTFWMTSKEESFEKSQKFGTYTLIGDSLLVRTISGGKAMNYKFTISSRSNLILEGGFEISEAIKRRPTFYLSKR